MRLTVKAGVLSDFFASARETAREIDSGKRITPKNTIWVDPKDLAALIKPERTELLRYLRGKKRVMFSDIVADMHRSPYCLGRDLKLLSKYQLVRIVKDETSKLKIIEPAFGKQKLEFKFEI